MPCSRVKRLQGAFWSCSALAPPHFLRAADFNPARSRQPSGLLGSIWAPQPQPSDTAWTKAIDSFTRVNFPGIPGNSMRPAPMHRSSSYPTAHNGEDVFGPPGSGMQRRRDVGAIGDGRKKLSPTMDEMVRCYAVGYMCAHTLTCDNL